MSSKFRPLLFLGFALVASVRSESAHSKEGLPQRLRDLLCLRSFKRSESISSIVNGVQNRPIVEIFGVDIPQEIAWTMTPEVRPETGEEIYRLTPVPGATERASNFYDASKIFSVFPELAKQIGVQIEKDGSWSVLRSAEFNQRAEKHGWPMRVFDYAGEAPIFVLVENMKDRKFVLSSLGQATGHDMAHIFGLIHVPSRIFDMWQIEAQFGEKILNDKKIRRILSKLEDQRLRYKAIEAILKTIYDDVEELTGFIASYSVDHDAGQRMALRGLLQIARGARGVADRIESHLYHEGARIGLSLAAIYDLILRVHQLAQAEPRTENEQISFETANEIVRAIDSKLRIKP